MGNRAVNQQKKQMVDLRKAVNAKATTKVLAMLKTFHSTNAELSKEACQALYYHFSREVSATSFFFLNIHGFKSQRLLARVPAAKSKEQWN